MITGSLARRYAKALFEIGIAQHNIEHVGADVHAIAAAMKESAELAKMLRDWVWLTLAMNSIFTVVSLRR